MEDEITRNAIRKTINESGLNFNYSCKETAIILAAGHGKRIKSHTSKMLHRIWEVPTVLRVCNACSEGLQDLNTLVVVGIKAIDVMESIGKRERTTFAYQEFQNGTGHAVQVALDLIDRNKYDGIVYVLPGDMGLIDAPTIKMFRESFLSSGCDMMVLTGLYQGDPLKNYYGRIIRVKEFDREGNPSGEDCGKVIQIIENKDIHDMPDQPYVLEFRGKEYSYSKQELIENNEFNSGVYAFRYKDLQGLISELQSNNSQGEVYITDLIALFNRHLLSVGAVSPQNQHVILGFNNKSVLKQMESYAREKAYEALKDIIEISDPEDFFIDESVIKDIIAADKKGTPLDLRIGKGVYIGQGVKLNYNLELKKNVFVSGNVVFGRDITVWENVHLSCFEGQKLELKDRVEILWGDIIKGNISIDEGSRIESSVNMTGSDEFPLIIGKDVLIKGTSYIFGSVIEDGIFIEHSVLIKKRIERLIKKDGSVQPVKFYLPMPEGLDAVDEIRKI